MGGASPWARSANTRAKFSPACFRPVKNITIRCPECVDTIPEVNSPVRSCELEDSSSIPAQITAQTFQLVDRGRDRRLPHHADTQGRFLLFVDLPLPTARTAIPRLQRGVRDLDAAGSPIRLRPVSTVSRLLVRRRRRGSVFGSSSQARLF